MHPTMRGVVIRRSVCKSSSFRELPSPVRPNRQSRNVSSLPGIMLRTYHFEVVQLLLDLLSKHGGQAVAGSNFAAAIVLSTGPCVVEDDSGAEGCVALARTLRSSGGTLGVLAEPEGRHKVVLIANSNGASPSVALDIVVGGAGCAGVWRVGNLRHDWQVWGGSSSF